MSEIARVVHLSSRDDKHDIQGRAVKAITEAVIQELAINKFPRETKFILIIAGGDHADITHNLGATHHLIKMLHYVTKVVRHIRGAPK